MAQTHKTGLIITGDASGGIRAIKATDDELGKLNQGFDRGSRRSRQFNQDVNATSQGLAVLRRAAAPIAGVIAGMFAANSLQNQINWADQLQKTNLRIGASTEALSQYNYVASLSGVEFNQLTTAWQRQTRRIAEAAAGTGVAVAALDRLNLSAQELNQLAPEDQFERIAEAMQGVENSSERVRLAQQLWDSEGVKLVQIVNQGTGAMAAMRAEADALGLTISQDTANAMASYNDEVDRLKFAAQGVSQTLLAELVPAMTAGLQETNAFIQQVGGAEVVVGHLTDGAQVLAALLAGRYAGAFATATAAKLAATQQSIAYQMALARMAGVSATAAGAQASLAAATRGAGAAMALVGGPLGAAMIAGGAIYYFREELGLVAPKVQSATDRVDDMTSALDANSEAALKNARAMLEAERQFQQFQQARLAMEVNRQQQIVADEQEQWDAVGGQQAFGMGMRSEAQQKLHDLRLELLDTRQAIEAAGGSVVEIDEKLEALERTTRDIIPPTTELGSATETAAAASREGAKQTTTLANSYENLLDRIQPNRRAARQYAQDVGTLNLALATGRMTTVQYMQAMGMLQESFQAAQRETDNLATASEDASQRIANSFLSWETVADNTLRRVDDSGQGLWLGLIDGSESALDTVKRGFQQTLAEIAHMLTTQRLTFHVAGMMGLDTTGMPGGGGGLNFGSMGSLYSSATKLPYVGDAISGVGSALGFGSSAAAGGTAVSGGFMSAAATQSASSLYGLAATGGAAPVSLMSSITSGISAAMPWLAGGLLVDNVLGLGIVDGIVGGISDLFGGGKSDPRLNISTRADTGQFSHESVRSGAFGAVGFSEGTKRSNDLFGSVEAEREWLASVAALDNLTAAAARTPEQLDAMTSAVQNMVLTSGDAQGAIDQLAGRTAAATRVIDAELTQTLLDAGASAEQIAQRFATARNAVDLITAASERLNLQYDANADGALRYADSLVQAFGSLDSITAIQDAYYNAAFSDQERLQHQYDDVRSALSGLTDEAPRTVAELRALVEAQQVNGGASQQLAYDLMALAPALKEANAGVRQAIQQQYKDALGRAPDATGLDYWFNQVATGALTLDQALGSIAGSMEAAIRDVYRTQLGREADAEGVNYWIGQVESGALTLDEALWHIATSVEGVSQEVGNAADALRDARSGVNSAFGDLRSLVQAEQRAISDAHNARIRGIDAEMQAVQSGISETQTLANALGSALNSMQSETLASQQMQRQQAQAQVSTALALARMTGGISMTSELENALRVVSEPSESLFGSFRDYQRDFYRTANEIAALESLTDEQLTADELQLTELQRQRDQWERQHNAEIERYDRMISSAETQVNTLLGIGASVDTIPAALDALEAAMRGYSNAGGGSAGGSTGGSTGGGSSGGVGVEQTIRAAYSKILQRSISDADIEYWSGVGLTGDDLARAIAHTGYVEGSAHAQRWWEQNGHLDDLPGFRAGGIADGPMSGYPVELHGREAIIPLQNGPLPLRIEADNNNPMLEELRRMTRKLEDLEKELEELRSINAGTAEHTSKLASETERMRRRAEQENA